MSLSHSAVDGGIIIYDSNDDSVSYIREAQHLCDGWCMTLPINLYTLEIYF